MVCRELCSLFLHQRKTFKWSLLLENTTVPNWAMFHFCWQMRCPFSSALPTGHSIQPEMPVRPISSLAYVFQPQLCYRIFIHCNTLISTLFFSFRCTARLVGSQFPKLRLNPCSLKWKPTVLTTGSPGHSKHLFQCSLKIVEKIQVVILANKLEFRKYVDHLGQFCGSDCLLIKNGICDKNSKNIFLIYIL